MSMLGRGLSTKITICVAVALVVSFVANSAYFSVNIRNEAYEAVKLKARAVLLQAESSRNFMASLRSNNAFNEVELKSAFDDKLRSATDKVAAARETVFFNTIPIIAAMKIAGEHASESGFKLKVPKVQARNKANEPDSTELVLLDKLEKENLPELFMVDKANNVVRYMRPIKLTGECLVCHGVPSDTLNKDGLDLLGMKAEGWKVGEQHGAYEILVDLSAIKAGIWHKSLVSFAIAFVITLASLLFLIWVIKEVILRPLSTIVSRMQRVAEGDLSSGSEDCRNDEIGELSRSIHGAVEKMRTTLTTVLESSCQVATAVGTVYATSEQMATGADEVAVQASTVATAGEEMAATSCDIASNCQMAAEGARTATGEATKGAEIIQSSIDVMSRIADQVRASANTVANLGNRSDQIGEIVGTIEDIADQTNLLALNAAIEAARAGEQGRGFAVVADEVRALAERTTRATHEISVMIKTIQVETKNAVETMNEGVREVEQGTAQATHSGEAIERILNLINDLGMQVNQIATAAEEQTATTGEISSNMTRINDIGRDVAAHAHISAVQASHLNGGAEALLSSLGKFRLDESNRLVLSKAKSAHMIFVGKIRAHLHGAQTVDPNLLPTHLTCAFGKWYQGDGKSSCGQFSLFREIDVPHAKVHELGKQAIIAYNSGDKAKADQCCNEMIEASTCLIEILDNLAGQCK
uniref:Methyl-accepting chemotaxis sensory transducer n=1 Tax=Geobacter sp. (strain M21) TaxID=443144 RepID=C6DYU5_GEOSM